MILWTGRKNKIGFASEPNQIYKMAVGTLQSLKAAAALMLHEQEKSVNVRAMLLVTAKLLSSAGKGRSAQAVPSDATNLLLGIMSGGYATEVAQSVRQLRGAEFRNLDVERKPVRLPSLACFQNLGSSYTLGNVLDGIFAEWAEAGGLVTRAGRRITEVYFSIEHHAFGHEAELYLIDDSGRFWVLTYLAGRDDVDYDGMANMSHEEIQRVIDQAEKQRGDRAITERVSHVTFATFAACLKDQTVEAARNELKELGAGIAKLEAVRGKKS